MRIDESNDFSPEFKNQLSKCLVQLSEYQYSICKSFIYITVDDYIFSFWTLITHKVFGVTLVFVPSIVACFLAIAPLLSPYMVYVIGFAELWLVDNQFLLGAVLVISGILPSFYIDGKIYEEVDSLKSPYFTGLAVVGGGYLFGIAGVLLGPLFLCSTLELIQFGMTSLQPEHRGSVQVMQTPITRTPFQTPDIR